MRKLRANKPGIENRHELRESIMDRLSNQKSFIDLFLGWTEIGWLRRSLAITSVFLVLFFGVQQLYMSKRIEKLEKRMISINTDGILQYQRKNVIANSVLFTDIDRRDLADSMKVATGDLLDLVKSYRELQLRYEDMLDKKQDGKQENNEQKL